jgi:hypothetical protein
MERLILPFSRVREMGCEDAPAPEFHLGILAMIDERATGLCHQFVHRDLIAKIVAMYHVHRHTEFDGCVQGIRTDQVTTMNTACAPVACALATAAASGSARS